MIELEKLTSVGNDLRRPECVLCTEKGEIYASDLRGGVTCIYPDGSQKLFSGIAPDGRTLKPNGIALRSDRSFLIADLSPEIGGVFHLTRDGALRPFIEHVDGIDLPPTNFVLEDIKHRVWITISTKNIPRTLSYRQNVEDGYIILVDEKGTRIVADQLGFANEVAIHPNGQWLYVNETFARRLSRFSLSNNGNLGVRETVTTFDQGTFPDGITFDADGFAWITSIISNRVIRVAFSGEQEILMEDSEPTHLAEVETAFQANAMGRPHIDKIKSRRLKNISSLAFGGPDLKTAYLGSLLGENVESFPSFVAGHPPAHWKY